MMMIAMILIVIKKLQNAKSFHFQSNKLRRSMKSFLMFEHYTIFLTEILLDIQILVHTMEERMILDLISSGSSSLKIAMAFIQKCNFLIHQRRFTNMEIAIIKFPLFEEILQIMAGMWQFQDQKRLASTSNLDMSLELSIGTSIQQRFQDGLIGIKILN